MNVVVACSPNEHREDESDVIGAIAQIALSRCER